MLRQKSVWKFRQMTKIFSDVQLSEASFEGAYKFANSGQVERIRSPNVGILSALDSLLNKAQE